MRRITVLSLILCLAVPVFAAEDAGYLKWFEEAKFGLFIHWGIYSLIGRGEWVMHNEKIPVEEYEKLQPQFNPTEFDAEKWVQLAQAAGMKYITITSKHHDGFCMFDSKLTDYTSMHSPAQRDFIGELTRACQKHGMKISYYYSLLDWHHPDYKTNLPAYIEYAKGQLRELCTNYGKIDGIWFDGGWEHSAEEWHSKEIIDMIRELQPGIVINNRARYDGDFDTPEQHVPGGQRKEGQRPWREPAAQRGADAGGRDPARGDRPADVDRRLDEAQLREHLRHHGGALPHLALRPVHAQGQYAVCARV